MGYNYKETNIDNVEFKDIQQPVIKTNGFKIARGAYVIGENNKITKPQPFVNAIDIDWNNAEITGLNDPITSTAQVLSILGDLNNKVNNGDGLGDGYKHVIITAEEYQELNEYDPKTIYFIVGEMEEEEEPTPSTDPIDISTDLYVNDVHYTENNAIITLTPGNEYNISGLLKGKIIIDASTTSIQTIVNTHANNKNAPDLEYTKITLNGVKIVSEDAYGIMYKIPTSNDPNVEYKGYKGMSITIGKNTFNSIICTKQEEGEDQPGAIYSMNNIEMQGAGYLAIQNNAGHGIRGQETKLTNIHLWVHASHDGVHGKNITIVGGTYYFDYCNDAFGTSSKGRILYFDGEIRYNDLGAQLFDSKQYGVYFNADLLSAEELEHCTGMHLISQESFNILVGRVSTEGVAIFEGAANGKIIGYGTKSDFDNGTNGDEVYISNGIPVNPNASNSRNTAERGYEISYPYIVVTGYIDAPLHFSSTVFDSNNDAQVLLRDAYVKTSYNYNSFYYDSKFGRIKIKADNDTLNIIENTYHNASYDRAISQSYDSDAIKSENNISIEINNGSILYLTSKGSDGIDGGEIKITDSKGILIIANCGMRGIKGNAVVIGPSAIVTDSVIESYITDPDAKDPNTNKSIYTTFDGICYVKNNCNYFNVGDAQGDKDSTERKNTGFADIYCRNGKATKGVFGTTNNELVGFLITDSIGYAISANLGNAAHLYYTSNVSANASTKPLTNDPGVSVETYFAKTINNTNIS